LILADTSVWIDHFRSGHQQLRQNLEHGRIVTHPFVVGELALGLLKDRSKTLALLDLLPHVPVARPEEVRAMIEARRLYGQGIGLTDAHLIASVFLSPSTLLWTRDKQLRRVAQNLGIQAGLV
jgi:predicted nucleic acid-binding protein